MVKVYEKSHFRSAKDLYSQINAFYSEEEIVDIQDIDGQVIVRLKDK